MESIKAFGLITLATPILLQGLSMLQLPPAVNMDRKLLTFIEIRMARSVFGSN